MADDALIARLMKTFLGEAEEHVRTLNQNLLALEKEPESPERGTTFKTLFRTAHSLKGAAHAVKLPIVETACHKLEELFAAANEGRRSIDPDLFQLLFRVVDAIQDIIKRLRDNEDVGNAPLAIMLPHLDASIADKAEPFRQRSDRPPQLVAISQSERLRSDRLVRIPSEKLDALLAQSGEVLVAQRRAEMRSEEAIALVDLVKRWRREWRTFERTAERLLRHGHRPSAGPATRDTAQPLPAASPQAAAAFRRATDSLRQVEQDLHRLASGLIDDRHTLGRAAGALDAEVRRARLLPFAEACQGLDRVVRDLTKAGDKQADLLIEGGDIEIDRSVLEGLRDPLLHLVRNAVDHGIEPVSTRRTRGKPNAGRIVVSASLRGARVEVVVGDDGGGLDLAAIRERARQKGLAESETERELVGYIFLPGFSTAPIVTEISGRGVGLDAVKSKVEFMRGTVDVAFDQGRGARFSLALPFTLTTIRALLVEACGQTFAVDNTAIDRLVRIGGGDLRSIEGRDVLPLGGSPAPVMGLAEILGLRSDAPVQVAGKSAAVVLATIEGRVGLLVDGLLGEQEVVVRSLNPRLAGMKSLTGAVILPTGRVALILNTTDLVQRALRLTSARPFAAAPAAQLAPPRKRLIVADDSVTTRTLEKSILEAAGYDVMTAADGLEAWRLLQQKGADLVVSDVQMPQMDGFDLTQTIRNSPRFRKIPVILVTGRESETDKARGLDVGADAYLLKSAFDQTALLETIRQIL